MRPPQKISFTFRKLKEALWLNAEEQYHHYATDMCHRKLQLKQWFEREHERLAKENRQK